MLYSANFSNTSPRSLSGAALAQRIRRLSAPERAILAAEIIEGRVVLQDIRDQVARRDLRCERVVYRRRPALHP